MGIAGPRTTVRVVVSAKAKGKSTIRILNTTPPNPKFASIWNGVFNFFYIEKPFPAAFSLIA
jgi:hypothetical protein